MYSFVAKKFVPIADAAKHVQKIAAIGGVLADEMGLGYSNFYFLYIC